MVAFANAYGGMLVLGIEEDKNSMPAVAKRICAIPMCAPISGLVRPSFGSCVSALFHSFAS